MHIDLGIIIIFLTIFYSFLVGLFAWIAYEMGKKHGAKTLYTCLNCDTEGRQGVQK